MTQSSTLDFPAIQQVLRQFDIDCDAPELHGIFSGLVSSGLAYDEASWLKPVQDLLNDGMELDKAMKKALLPVFDSIITTMKDPDMVFSPLQLDDDEALSDRAYALVQWVQGFLIGFNLTGKPLSQYSDDVREVLEDFTEITKLDVELDESEEGEQAIFEVFEYVKVSSLLCFNECAGAYQNLAQQGSQRLH